MTNLSKCTGEVRFLERLSSAHFVNDSMSKAQPIQTILIYRISQKVHGLISNKRVCLNKSDLINQRIQFLTVQSMDWIAKYQKLIPDFIQFLIPKIKSDATTSLILHQSVSDLN